MKMGPLAVRWFRICGLTTLLLLVREQQIWLSAQQEGDAAPPLADVRHLWPQAASVGPKDPATSGWEVRDREGNRLGTALTTFPEAAGRTGYAGPTNTLLALNERRELIGARILSSRDTVEHVEKVVRDHAFWDQFRGSELPRHLHGVAGATLSSLVVVETARNRLHDDRRGPEISDRFPEDVTWEETKSVFPDAERWEEPGSDGVRGVFGAGSIRLGWITRGAPAVDDITGYQGPTDSLIGLAPDGNTVSAFRLRTTFDNEEFVSAVREDAHYLPAFIGRTLEELAGMDFAREGLEGVAGATRTSWAVAEGLKTRASQILAARAMKKVPPRIWWQETRWLLAAGFTAFAVLLAHTRLRGKRWIRRLWFCAMLAYTVWLGGDLLTLALISGWGAGQAVWWATPAALHLVALAFLVPWATGRQWYCHQFCPAGGIQQALARLNLPRVKIPRRLGGILETAPVLLLVTGVILLLLGRHPRFAAWEAFDAFWWELAAWSSIGLAVGGLVFSLFIPNAYCRFGCPTGALLRFIRTKGAGDRFGRGEWVLLACLILGGVAWVFRETLARWEGLG